MRTPSHHRPTKKPPVPIAGDQTGGRIWNMNNAGREGRPWSLPSELLARWIKHVAPPVWLARIKKTISCVEDASHVRIIADIRANATDLRAK
jgi:hypothetical protein